ncbi:MAG: rod shape-determining protein RodA [Armatimonadota bacterium]
MPIPRVDPRYRKNVDWILAIAVAVLLVAGLLFLWSATAQSPRGTSVVLKQAGLIGIGLGLMVFCAALDYSTSNKYAPFIHAAALLLLLVVTVFFRGEETKGATRWIPLPMGFKLQPSEFAKVALVLTLSSMLRSVGGRIREFPVLLRTLGHALMPMALVAAQPDLTTALVFAAIWFAMAFTAGADLRHLGAILVAGAVVFSVLWNTGVVRQYQKDRVLILLGLKVDKQRKGYQIDQALAAVGGGEATGQGLGKGIQNRGSWVPENHTDFIFTVIAEETGFLGSVALLALYGLVLVRGLMIAAESEDAQGRLIAVGVTTLFGFHIFVNVGMNCGILPVAGVPLPLVSQGGSAAWTSLSAIGLLQSVAMRRRALQF